MSDYIITDKRLFSNDTIHVETKRITINNNVSNLNNLGNSLIASCWNVGWTSHTCNTPNDPRCISGCDNCGYPTCYQETTEIDMCAGGGSVSWPPGGIGGVGGGGPSGGGSGGGGQIPYYYPCNPLLTSNFTGTPVNNVGTDPLPPCPPPSGGSGWNPSNPSTFQPNLAPPPIIDTSISNNYPCLVKIIDTLCSSGNLNRKAQVLLNSLFGENKYVHIKLKMNASLAPGTEALTEQMYTYTNPPDTNTHFAVTIGFNPLMMSNGTKEYIASTILHESMHAYIGYIIKQYTNGLGGIDSNYIKTKFPIFWKKDHVSTSELASHNVIANNWVQSIASSLYNFTNNDLNPIMKDSLYRSLAWGGLEDTDIFKSNPSKCSYTAINVAAGHRNNTLPFTLLNNPSCTSIYNITAQSLKLKNPCD